VTASAAPRFDAWRSRTAILQGRWPEIAKGRMIGSGARVVSISLFY
jgi:hypothetical protein